MVADARHEGPPAGREVGKSARRARRTHLIRVRVGVGVRVRLRVRFTVRVRVAG